MVNKFSAQRLGVSTTWEHTHLVLPTKSELVGLKNKFGGWKYFLLLNLWLPGFMVKCVL